MWLLLVDGVEGSASKPPDSLTSSPVPAAPLSAAADNSCQVWVVNPARGGQREVGPAALERSWQEVAAEIREQHEAEGLSEAELSSVAPTFLVAYVRGDDAALTALQRALRGFKDRAKGPTMLLLSSPDQQQLQHALPAIADMAYATIPVSLRVWWWREGRGGILGSRDAAFPRLSSLKGRW